MSSLRELSLSNLYATKPLRYIDSYGDLVEEDWNKEVKKFTKKRSGEILEFIINHTPEVIYKELKKQKQYYYLDSENFYYEILSIVDLNEVIYAELSGDFPLGDSRQPIYKSLRPFDLVS
ncbi:hypothetical protein ACWB2Z_19860 [Acinetobacter baumannii]